MLKLLQHKITEILTLNLDPRWGQVPIYFLLSLNWITFWGAGQALRKSARWYPKQPAS
jgi:hypothetical protein